MYRQRIPIYITVAIAITGVTCKHFLAGATVYIIGIGSGVIVVIVIVLLMCNIVQQAIVVGVISIHQPERCKLT